MKTYAVVMQTRWKLFSKEKSPQFKEFVCANSIEEVRKEMYKKYSLGWLDGGAYPIAIYELVWEGLK